MNGARLPVCPIQSVSRQRQCKGMSKTTFNNLLPRWKKEQGLKMHCFHLLPGRKKSGFVKTYIGIHSFNEFTGLRNSPGGKSDNQTEECKARLSPFIVTQYLIQLHTDLWKATLKFLKRVVQIPKLTCLLEETQVQRGHLQSKHYSFCPPMQYMTSLPRTWVALSPFL